MEQSRIGFISTRFSGTDGVSLEARKWVNILTRAGHTCYFFSGESDWPEENSFIVPEAHFNHPEIRKLNIDLFGDFSRQPETSKQVERLKNHLKEQQYQFVQRFEPDFLIVENALSLPLNIPLGLALTEMIAETGIPVIAHHHDFAWERNRFLVGAADDYIQAAFPPTLANIYHVVINSYAQRQLSWRAGISSTLIPNVMNFDAQPAPPGDYTDDFRVELGIRPDEHLLLQPTRVVPRKRIESAIELAHRLELNCVLLITHESGDEGQDYEFYLREYATLLGVKVIFAADRFAPQRGQSSEGEKIYSLADAYSQSSLVTYPSRLEGFGNAFLEAIYYRRPILMSSYVIYITDIQPKGFRLITFDEYLDRDCVRRAREILLSPDLAEEMAVHNFELGRQHYSFELLENRLRTLLIGIQGMK